MATLVASVGRMQTRQGGRWWPGTARYVLDNPKYRGQVEYLFRYGEAETHVLREGAHPALVS